MHFSSVIVTQEYDDLKRVPVDSAHGPVFTHTVGAVVVGAGVVSDLRRLLFIPSAALPQLQQFSSAP